MSEIIQVAKKEDIVMATQKQVVCDGTAKSKHPRVYLTMVDDENGIPQNVVCPYCSRVFRYQS